MSHSVQMPALGESVTEGTVTRWLKNVGDQVEVDVGTGHTLRPLETDTQPAHAEHARAPTSHTATRRRTLTLCGTRTRAAGHP